MATSMRCLLRSAVNYLERTPTCVYSTFMQPRKYFKATPIVQIICRNFSTTECRQLKEISEKSQGDVLVIEGINKDSERKHAAVSLGEKDGACPLCRLNMEVRYTDVLILSQFLRPDGCLIPRRITGLCKKQQQQIRDLVGMAQRAGLMLNMRPPLSGGKERAGLKSNWKWKKFNTYFQTPVYK